MMPRMFAPRPPAGRMVSATVTWTGILPLSFAWTSATMVAKDAAGTILQTWSGMTVQFAGGTGTIAVRVPAETATLSLVFRGKTLRTRLSLPAGTGPAVLAYTMWPGDVYPVGVGDGTINIVDRTFIGQKYNQVYPAYDLNGNPDVPIDMADYAIVTANVGRTSDPE